MKRLIGWRTADFLLETTDRDQALNWQAHHEILPIFEGDPNTRLKAVEQPDTVLSMLGEDDMYWLRRFRDCREDDEDEHDLPEAAILSLETLGALRSIGHEQHEITKFGDYLLGKESV